MPLQSLPVEILCIILRRIGNSQLRKQLLACKWWYKLAKPILLEELTVSANQLIRLPEQALAKYHYQLFLRLLKIDLHGTTDWPVNQDNELDRILNSLIRDGHRLTSFTLRARSQFDPAEPLAPRHHYLSMWSPARPLDDLQVSKISNLEIDTCGSDFEREVHVCPRLALVIPHMRNVRLRMHSICPQIFDWKGYGPSPPKTEIFIVNISLMERNRFSAGFSHHCTEPKNAWALYNDMVHAAEELAKQILGSSNLKVLRILCHKHPWLEAMVKDCITGTEVRLKNDSNDKWYRRR